MARTKFQKKLKCVLRERVEGAKPSEVFLWYQKTKHALAGADEFDLFKNFVKISTMTDKKNTTNDGTTNNNLSEKKVLASLKEKITELESQLKNAEQAKMRALADLENFRRREGESRTNWSRDAIADWTRNFIPSLQELLLGAEHTSDKDVQKVIEKFMGKLDKQGLKKIAPTTGDEINPNEHSVLMAADGEPGKVVQVLEAGWKLGENVILPAKISGAPIS